MDLKGRRQKQQSPQYFHGLAPCGSIVNSMQGNRVVNME
jgi:hypothetical protein